MSDFRYEIKTPLPVIWLENIDTKNPGWSVRNERNTLIQLILVDPVEEDVEDFVHGLISKRLTMRSKEKKEYYHSSDRIDHHLYIGFGYWLMYSNIFNVITD